jgi:DNA mismatch repair ATPase MutS
MDTKEAYKTKLKAQLAEWDAQINLFAAKTKNAAADVQVKYAQELDELRNKQRKASDKLKELEHASGDAWQEIKVSTDQLWDDIKTGVTRTLSKFK